MATSKPSCHTSPTIDHIAGKLMHSAKSETREVAAAALSHTRQSAHTRGHVASLAGSLMHAGNKQECSLVASVLADHKTKK